MNTYFVIYNVDGNTHVREMPKSQLLEWLAPDEEGSGLIDGSKVMATLREADTAYWRGGILIIKGDIVTPRIAEVVLQYEID